EGLCVLEVVVPYMHGAGERKKKKIEKRGVGVLVVTANDGLIISLSLFLTFSVNGQLIPGTTSSTSISTRRKLLSAPSSRLPRISSIKCSSSRDTEAPPKDLLLKNLAKSLAVASVSSAASFFLFPISNLPSLAAETEMTVLSGFKKYKVSDIVFFEIRPGGVYTKAQLQKELETLATCGMFEKVDLEGETKPDGTLGVTISFAESTCQSADRFRCFNVGLMVQSKPIEMDADMTDKEKLEYCRSGGWIGRYHVCCMRLWLFSNIEVNPRQDEKKRRKGGIIVEIKLKWSLVPGPGGPPTLGLNRSLMGSVTTSNFLNPQDDLSFKL
ncbi:hypothetical protein F2Q70_00000710, partial [Brassica cretica]